MSIYRFGNDSLVDEITFHHTGGGGARAYLHARPGADMAALDALKKSLTSSGLQSTPIEEDGKAVLEVRGYRKADDNLLDVLYRNGSILGKYQKEETPDDKITFWDKLKKNTLRASGVTYFIGDMSYLTYGAREAFDIAGKLTKPQSLAAAIFYAAGSPFMWAFGHGDKSSLQLKHLSYNMINELSADGVKIPKDAAIHDVANGHNSTLGKKIHTFLSRYPSEMTNAIFGLAGSMIIWEKAIDLKTFKWHPLAILKQEGFQGLKASLNRKEFIRGQSAHDLKSVLMDIGLGALTVSAGLVSVFVQEEVPKPDEPKQKGLARAWQWVKEKPLRTAGYLLIASTGAHAGSTWVDYKYVKSIDTEKLPPIQVKEVEHLRGSLPRRALFVALSLLAEGLMSISSKGHGDGVISDNSLEHSSFAVAADLVARTTPEKREEVLAKTVAFLSGKKHLGGDAKVIEEGVRAQLATINANPWACLAPPAPKSDTQPEEEKTNWRGRTIASQQMAQEATVPAF